MRLPTNSLSRSRLMVSTSGSSGTALPAGGLFFCCCFPLLWFLGRFGGRRQRRQLRPRVAGGGLLGLLLRPALALALDEATHGDGGEEALGVVGTLVPNVVA